MWEFCLPNPDPEIDPEIARKHAAVVATGRSNQPNQINNVLVFPGIFRGLLNGNITKITDDMLIRAAGGWVGVQRALNGQINNYSNASFATSQLNFITGTSFLLLLLLLRSLFTDHSIMNFSTGPWWMFLGGSMGVIYIAFSAIAVQHLGVLDFTLFSVGGMLFGSLLIDLLAPTAGTRISGYLIAGIFITYLGVITNGQSRLSRR